MRLEDKGRRNGVGGVREDDRKQDEERMFAELRLVAPQPARQETYGGKLVLMMWQTFGIFAVGERRSFSAWRCAERFVLLLRVLLPSRKRVLSDFRARRRKRPCAMCAREWSMRPSHDCF